MMCLLIYMMIGTAFLQFLKSYGEVDSLDVFLAIIWPVTFVGMAYELFKRSQRRRDDN